MYKETIGLMGGFGGFATLDFKGEPKVTTLVLRKV